MELRKNPKRRRHEERHENHERWIISYADFMTLLMATFVMLYAISSVNVSKYRILQQVFAEAFLGKMVHEDAGLAPQRDGVFNHLPAPIPVPQRNISPMLRKQVEQRVRQLEQIYQRLTKQFQGLIQKDLVHVKRQPTGVTVDINATLLFASGSAELTPQALTILDQVGKILADVPYTVQVNGFTDNAPIHNTQFDSNWDLSAIRAISVVKRFVTDGIAPERLVGAGFGEYHPVAPNDSPDGMAKNRRVSIVVVAPEDAEHAGSIPALTAPQPAMPAPAPTAAPTSTPTPALTSAPTSTSTLAPASTPAAAAPIAPSVPTAAAPAPQVAPLSAPISVPAMKPATAPPAANTPPPINIKP